MNPTTRCLVALLAILPPVVALAHEVETDRVTLVQREPNHIALTFYLDYVGLLQRILAPGSTRPEFAILCATMANGPLQTRIRQAQGNFETTLQLSTPAGKRLAIGPLHWPDFASTQALLREAAMGAVVAAGEHSHTAPVEITGEAIADAAVTGLQVRLPPSLEEVIVVSYTPTQRRIKPAAHEAVTVRF